MYYEDKFIEYAINEGIPLSTVTATDSFAEHDKGIYKSSVIIAAAPFAGTKFESEVIDYVKNGGKVIFYGDFKRSGELFKAFRNEYKANNTEWIEFSGTEENKEKCCKLFWDALRKMNFSIVFDKENEAESPKLTIHRFNNAYIFSQYSPNTTVETKIRFPFGAPILDCWTAKLESGYSCYHFPKSERKECRVFVEQENGSVNCSECPPVSILYRRSIHISGLENATVRILAENYCKDNVHVFRKRRADWFYDEQTGEYEKIGSDIFYRLDNVCGQLYICMPHKADLAHND